MTMNLAAGLPLAASSSERAPLAGPGRALTGSLRTMAWGCPSACVGNLGVLLATDAWEHGLTAPSTLVRVPGRRHGS